ncbi:N-acetylmuramoyl-L-alanine amidase [Streptosporangium sp. NBC_01810]|uniref:peptidoglycan recognition protein family protein n=1 Tax=Streptosporangium sp. NBC_01810 TaxID=2975951 RepID=UPI002DDAA535|nr:N-acetylmuramoyl-L-alanine amidase [Streptosporangium sp. NBC_01810]WSA27408.1 N-acetylmuramoyl-L-alanine amidase [Streptosporangium sp. NBC_01810]
MPYLTQLADVARRTGYPVTEVPGWKTRGHGPQPEVYGVVCHHTAGWGDMHVVRDGRPGLEGPLSQIWLRRDGRIFVVAAGRCWHNAPSTSLGHTNSNSIGIEAENDGRTPWPPAQLESWWRLCAELCKEFQIPVSAVRGHKEVNRSKPDPHTLHMDDFRAIVARLIAGEDDDVSAKEMWQHELPVPFGSKENPEWQAGNILVNTAKWAKDVRETIATLGAKLDGQTVAIKALAEALAARDDEIDVEALVARIEAAIEGITVRLEVSSPAAP